MILTRSSLYRGLHWGACAILVMLWLGAAGQQAFSPTAYPGVTLPVVMATGAAIILWCLVDAIRTAEQPWALRVAVVFTFGCGVVQWWGAYPPSAPTVLPPLLILASASYGVAGFALGPIGGVVVSVLAAGTIFLARRDLLGTTESALTALPHLTTGCLAALAIAIMARTATKVETALGQVWEERETQARARSLSAASVRWDSLIHDKVLGALRLAARARTPADRAGAAELAADAISSFRVVGSPASLGDLSDAPAMLALVTDDRLAEDGQPWGGDLGWAAPAWFEGQLRRHALRLGLHLHWEVQADGSTAILPSSQARAVMDAAVEALSNVARHSGVDSATASGAFEAGRITLRITDSGRGFDPGQVGAGRAGVSRGIVARVAIVGGTASVRSRPGHGTTVTIDVHAPSPRGPFATTQTWNPLDFVAIFAIAAVALIDYAALALVHADGARSLPVLGACLMFAYLLGTVATFTPRRFAPAAYAAGLGCGVLAFVSTVNLVDPGQIGWHYWFVGITNPTIAVLMFRFPSRWALATVASVVTGIALGQAVSGGVHVGVLVDTSPQLIAFAMASWGIRTALDGATAYLNTAAAGLGRLRVATAALEEADRVAAERTRSLGSRVEAMLRRIAAAEELDASDAARCLVLEAATRDRLVAGPLVSPAVAAAVQVCRARGTTVVLTAESPSAGLASEAAAPAVGPAGAPVVEPVAAPAAAPVAEPAAAPVAEEVLESFRRVLVAALQVAGPQARVLARWRPGRDRRLGSISIVGSSTVDRPEVREVLQGAIDGHLLDVDLSIDEESVLVDVRLRTGVAAGMSALATTLGHIAEDSTN